MSSGAKTIMVSGGFDPLHCGHINLFSEAKKLGDRLFVAVESDEWVARKRKLFMPQDDRISLVRELSLVDDSYPCRGTDGCSSLIRLLRPFAFVVGPDHPDIDKLEETKACRQVDTQIICLNQLEKTRSSSDLIAKSGFDSLNLPVTANAIICGERGVLLGVRNQQDSGHSKLELIGGFVDAGESLEEAVVREIQEEVSLSVSSLKYFGSLVGTYFDGRKVLSTYFTCMPEGVPTTSEEVSKLIWTKEPVSLATDCDTLALNQYFMNGKAR